MTLTAHTLARFTQSAGSNWRMEIGVEIKYSKSQGQERDTDIDSENRNKMHVVVNTQSTPSLVSGEIARARALGVPPPLAAARWGATRHARADIRALYAGLLCPDHRVPILICEEDLHEAVVVYLSLEVRDGLRHHVVDLVLVQVLAKHLADGGHLLASDVAFFCARGGPSESTPHGPRGGEGGWAESGPRRAAGDSRIAAV